MVNMRPNTLIENNNLKFDYNKTIINETAELATYVPM